MAVEQVGNITGLGSLDRLTDEDWKELNMAYSLNPLFKVLQLNIQTLRSTQYISKRGFQNRYPWELSSEARFHENVLNQDFYRQALPKNNPDREIFWTDLYISLSREELMFTCAAPVYKNNIFRGVVAIDFSLQAVDDFIDSISHRHGRLLVFNDRETVLGDTDSPPDGENDQETITRMRKVLPENVNLNLLKSIEEFKLVNIGDYWVFRARTTRAPWTVLYYMNTWDFESSIWLNIGPSVLLILIFGAVVMIGDSSYYCPRVYSSSSTLSDAHYQPSSGGVSGLSGHSRALGLLV